MTSAAAACYDVAFDAFLSLQRNQLGFRGPGAIAIDRDGIAIAGRRRRFFRWERDTLALPFAAIEGAQLDGEAVRMVVQPGRTRLSRRIVIARFADAAAARAFVTRLDAARVPRDAGVPGAVDFDARILLAHPHAPVTPVLIAANLAAFLALALAGGGFVTPHADIAIRWGANFGPLTTGGEWWRLASSAFIHFGVVHLAVNMLALWDAGRLVERLYGSVHFLFIYAASGIAGALASVAWNPWVNSAGASGAIFGVLGALIAYVTDRRNGLPPAVMRFHFRAAVVFVAYSLAYGFLGTNIDNAAHLGGLATGLGLGFMLALPLAEDRPRWSPASAGAAAIALAAASVILVQFVRDTGPAYRAELEFRAALEHAALEARRTEASGETARGAFGRYRLGEISREALARAIEADAALHDEEVARFRALPLDPGSPSGMAQARDTVVTALELRRDALRLAASSVREGNPLLMKSAERKMAEANALVRKARAAQDARRPGAAGERSQPAGSDAQDPPPQR